jgi:methylglutamate dehydrogenase subunit D
MAKIMLQERSPLADCAPIIREGLAIAEDAGFTLTQLSGFGKNVEKELASAIGKLPSKIGIAGGSNGTVIFRIAPQQFWVIGKDAPRDIPPSCLVTPLSSSRCRISLSGDKSRAVLARCATLDFSAASFRPGHFAMTGIHHTPVTIHCINENTFHLYALRTFALSVWEWISDAAEGLES